MFVQELVINQGMPLAQILSILRILEKKHVHEDGMQRMHEGRRLIQHWRTSYKTFTNITHLQN